MHFYWRIIEELKFLGEIVVFKNPNLLRCYKFWLEEHAGAITLSTTGDITSTSVPFSYRGISPSLN
ncbi:MAG: hypothetical protein B1H12_08805 [Desulfobacteraceae bacterium 4484_190.2]|nr:MAG: hypothetical protein B1H12_08805 [Desulfobacteraceae bacterium 4484_190.2]